MEQKFKDFKNYHYQNSPLILGNVWDVSSAVQLQDLDFKAIGTSSAAIASMLGYEDGENMPFDEYLMIIKRISKNTELPISVDLENGYGKDPQTVIDNIKRLSQLGIVGINLEDSIIENGTRTLVAADIFKKKIKEIHSQLIEEKIDMFINLRVDTFLLQLPNALEESLRRISVYSDFIDGIFIPCISEENDIKEIIKHTTLPLNVMSVPNLPDFETLKNLGVRRISSGNFLFDFKNHKFRDQMESIISNQNFNTLFEG